MSEWISVDDRLPDLDVPVLARIAWQPETIIATYSKFVGDKYEWDEQSEYEDVQGDACVSHSLYSNKVTHWMPLPEPRENKS